MSESDYPYKGRDATCAYDKSKVIADSTVKHYYQVPIDNSLQLKAAVNQQPVSIGINAAGLNFQLYFGGIMSSFLCPANLDHGVMIVGYDTQPAGFLKAKTPYWRIKNSWG